MHDLKVDSKIRNAGMFLPTIEQSELLDFAWIELTNRCNLSCKHCYSMSGPQAGDDDRISYEKYVETIREIYSLGCRKIQFIGGEATTFPGIESLIDECHVLGFEFVEVFSNLYSLRPSLLKKIEDSGSYVATSFYSRDPDTHDSITLRPGSWQRTVENIRRIVEHKIPLRVAVILMDENAGEFTSCGDFLRGMGVTRIEKDDVRPFGRAADDAQTEEEMSSLCGACSGGTICIGYDGRVSPCIMSKKWSIGSVNDHSLSDMIRSRSLRTVRDDIARATNTLVACTPQHSYCQPKAGDNCTPKTACGPDHHQGCRPKY